MPFKIIRDDITRVHADAIVNSANPRPVCGGGTDAAIYEAAGYPELLAARREIGPIPRGAAAVTGAFRLPAKYIIHTVGPKWLGGGEGEAATLASCYESSLALAKSLQCESIAFPLISAGSYHFPRELALSVATETIARFLEENEMQVTLVVFDRRTFVISSELTADIESFIDEHYAYSKSRREYGRRRRFEEELFEEELMHRRFGAAPRAKEADPALELRVRPEPREEDAAPALEIRACPEPTPEDAGPALEIRACPAPREVKPGVSGYVIPKKPKAPPEPTIDEILSELKEDTFQQRLFRLIDARGLKDPVVYKRANIDRKLFSKIRSNADYHPTKETVFSLAIALRLSLEETRDLLARANLAFSPASQFDLIIEYFISKQNYDVCCINAVLFKYGEDQLGA